ncbi:hypothetical protein OG21DRAFT_953311 [Imleria badia]|nr:hypothetical protein OG21DRAFT_953311 [Imleria badia]
MTPSTYLVQGTGISTGIRGCKKIGNSAVNRKCTRSTAGDLRLRNTGLSAMDCGRGSLRPPCAQQQAITIVVGHPLSCGLAMQHKPVTEFGTPAPFEGSQTGEELSGAKGGTRPAGRELRRREQIRGRHHNTRIVARANNGGFAFRARSSRGQTHIEPSPVRLQHCVRWHTGYTSSIAQLHSRYHTSSAPMISSLMTTLATRSSALSVVGLTCGAVSLSRVIGINHPPALLDGT